MATKHADVVIVGLGASGAILAKELTAAGFRVLGIEKGPEYSPQDFWLKFDELRYSIRCGISPTMDRDPITWRPNADQRGHSPPLGGWSWRRESLFLPRHSASAAARSTTPAGTGGKWREDFRMRSVVLEHFGEAVMPDGSRIVDWPVSYEELEPYYAQVEREIGVPGQAGNINGERIPGGNPSRRPVLIPTPSRRSDPAPRISLSSMPATHSAITLPRPNLDHFRRLGRAQRVRLLRLLPGLRLPRRGQVLDPGRADSRRPGDRQSGDTGELPRAAGECRP